MYQDEVFMIFEVLDFNIMFLVEQDSSENVDLGLES